MGRWMLPLVKREGVMICVIARPSHGTKTGRRGGGEGGLAQQPHSASTNNYIRDGGAAWSSLYIFSLLVA